MIIVDKVKTLMAQSDLADQAARGAPAIGGAVVGGLTLNTWVLLATGIYIVLQIAYLSRKWWREEKDYARKPKGRKP